ncbi:nascent polypeptide-associated complex protein [Candidatus Pacearchaeota archaeon]|nr:nascent polypeptide-associated complex protein [Candidatus Pacearchaeota archaeon]
MFGNLGGINPGQMKAMMKQMGITQESIPAMRVIIEQEGKRMVIANPGVEKITMKGQVSWQITGDATEESAAVSFSEEDVQLVVDQTGKSETEVRKVLGETKDLAETISRLS